MNTIFTIFISLSLFLVAYSNILIKIILLNHKSNKELSKISDIHHSLNSKKLKSSSEDSFINSATIELNLTDTNKQSNKMNFELIKSIF